MILQEFEADIGRLVRFAQRETSEEFVHEIFVSSFNDGVKKSDRGNVESVPKNVDRKPWTEYSPKCHNCGIIEHLKQNYRSSSTDDNKQKNGHKDNSVLGTINILFKK